MASPKILLLGIVLSALATGCAHAPVTRGMDPKVLLADACRPGSEIKSIKGTVWLKAASKDASGQFPAYVLAKDPDSLRLEVTNLVGGTEAVITVDGQKYRIESHNKK